MIIGLCGVAGAGKKTIADHLVAQHGFAKVALADPLKRISRAEVLARVLHDAFPYLSAEDVVVPDVMYRNEVDAIQAAGGLVVRVVRPHDGLVGDAGKHTSETEQIEIHNAVFRGGVIGNASTLESLYSLIDYLLPEWRDQLGLA